MGWVKSFWLTLFSIISILKAFKVINPYFSWNFYWDNYRFACSYKKEFREISCTLFPVFSSGNNLRNFCISSPPGRWHWQPTYLILISSVLLVLVCMCVESTHIFFRTRSVLRKSGSSLGCFYCPKKCLLASDLLKSIIKANKRSWWC